MASIRKKGDGWEARWYAGASRRSKILHGTRREVELEARTLEAVDKGRPMTSGPLTMADLLTMWVVRGGRRRSPLTTAAVDSRTRKWTIPRLGHLPVEKVTHLTLEGFYAELAEHLKPGSINNIRWDLSGALNLAVLDGHIDRNPATRARFRPMASEPAEIVPPTVAEIAAFLAFVDRKRTMVAAEVAIACRLATATGARLGEVCALRWTDFDPGPPAITIAHNAISHGGKVELRATKTRVRRRLVIGDTLAARIEERHVRFPEAVFLVRGSRPELPLNPHTLSSRFQAQRNEAGATFRFHDLRHFYASALLSDLGPHAASRAVGHARYTTTTEIYGHMIDPEVDRRAAEAIGRRIDL